VYKIVTALSGRIEDGEADRRRPWLSAWRESKKVQTFQKFFLMTTFVVALRAIALIDLDLN